MDLVFVWLYLSLVLQLDGAVDLWRPRASEIEIKNRWHQGEIHWGSETDLKFCICSMYG